MKKQKPPWLQRIPVDPNKLSFDELRYFKDVDAFLSEPVYGPEGLVYFLRCFKLLTVFAMTCVAENRYPPLTRCWEDLEKFFIDKHAFQDVVFVQAWIFFDFPFGNDGETLLDFYEEYLKNEIKKDHFQCFVDQMRKSRMGLYQEILSSRKTIKFRELITEQTTTIARNDEAFEKGEIFLTRLVEFKGQILQLGGAKRFPKADESKLLKLVRENLTCFNGSTEKEQYENLMKLAGPFWLSFLTSSASFPVLKSTHYHHYLKE